MNIQDFFKQWMTQAQANQQQSLEQWPANPPPPADPNAGFVRNIPSMIPNINPRYVMAPIDYIGAIPGVAEANRSLWGNRDNNPSRLPQRQLRQSSTTPALATTVSPTPPSVSSPISGGASLATGGTNVSSNQNSPLWAAPNIRAGEEIKLDPGYEAAGEKMRQAIAALQQEIRPNNNFGQFSGLPGALMQALAGGLLDYGANSDWGDVARGAARRADQAEQARRMAAELGLRIPELELDMAGQRQRVSEANTKQRNETTRAQDAAGYEYGRDISVERRRRFEGDRADSRAREGLAIQREGINRAETRAAAQEDLLRLNLAAQFGGPQADRALINRAYGDTPEGQSVMRTRVLGAVRNIAGDSRGVRSLNQILENGGAGIKIKNNRDTQGMMRAAEWLQANPTWLDATAAMLGYGESPEVAVRPK